MDKKIQKLYLTDNITVVLCLFVFLILLIMVTLSVLSLGNEPIIKLGVMSAVILIGLFGTASSIAVLAHLKTNKFQVYSEEINSYQKDDTDQL